MRVSFRSIEFPPNKVRLLVFPVCPLADEPGVNNRRAYKGTCCDFGRRSCALIFFEIKSKFPGFPRASKSRPPARVLIFHQLTYDTPRVPVVPDK
jgi:hypothetical protein